MFTDCGASCRWPCTGARLERRSCKSLRKLQGYGRRSRQESERGQLRYWGSCAYFVAWSQAGMKLPFYCSKAACGALASSGYKGRYGKRPYKCFNIGALASARTGRLRRQEGEREGGREGERLAQVIGIRVVVVGIGRAQLAGSRSSPRTEGTGVSRTAAIKRSLMFNLPTNAHELTRILKKKVHG